MKKIKFKKWIITAITSFALAIMFLIIGIVMGGSSILTNFAISTPNFEHYIIDGIEQSGILTDTNEFYNQSRSNENFDKEVSVSTSNDTDNGCVTTKTITINGDTKTYTNDCDDDFETTDQYTQFADLTKQYSFYSNDDLDNYLDEVITLMNSNNIGISGDSGEDFMDAIVDLIDAQMLSATIPEDAKNNEDFKDYFERTQLSNVDIDQYVESYLAKNL